MDWEGCGFDRFYRNGVDPLQLPQLIIGPLSFGLNVYLFVTTLAYEELRDIKYFHVALMTLCEIIFLPCQWIRTVYRVSHSLVQEQDYHNAFYEYLGVNTSFAYEYAMPAILKAQSTFLSSPFFMDFSSFAFSFTDFLNSSIDDQSEIETAITVNGSGIGFLGRDNFVTPGITSDETRRLFKRFDSATDITAEITGTLNKCSTGICLLAITIERYIFICHPMKATTLLSKPRHVLFCVTSTILAVLSSCIHLYEQIIQRNSLCYPEYLRKANIIMFTLTVVFFVIPAASCMALFVEIWLALRKMLTHQERNEQISKALAFTYISWIILWTPHTMFDLTATFKHSDWFGENDWASKSDREWGNTHYPFWNNFMESLGLLYSTITPFIFIVLIRPFQVPLITFSERIKRKKSSSVQQSV